jgi:hypothetical protein
MLNDPSIALAWRLASADLTSGNADIVWSPWSGRASIPLNRPFIKIKFDG